MKLKHVIDTSRVLVVSLVFAVLGAAQSCPHPWPSVSSYSSPGALPAQVNVGSPSLQLQLLHGSQGYTIHRLVHPSAGTIDFLPPSSDPLSQAPNAYGTNPGLPGAFPIVSQPTGTGLFTLMMVEPATRNTKLIGPSSFSQTRVFNFGSVVFLLYSGQNVVPGSLYVLARIWCQGGGFDFDIRVLNFGTGHALTRVAYPTFKAPPFSVPDPLLRPTDFDVLVTPVLGGVVQPDPTSAAQPYPRIQPIVYPGASMQLFSLYKANAAQYSAAKRALVWYTKDGHGEKKEFMIDRGIDACVPGGGVCNPLARSTGVQSSLIHFPPANHLSGSSYFSLFPFTLTAVRGDWYEAAEVYRAWALTQPFAQRGPIETSATFSTLMREMRLHVLQYPDHLSGFDSFPSLAVDAATIAGFIGLPQFQTLTLWSDWDSKLFNVEMPDFDAPRDSVEGGLALAHQLGVRVLPYLHVDLWSEASDDFGQLQVQPFVWKDINGVSPLTFVGPSLSQLDSAHLTINPAHSGARSARAAVISEAMNVFAADTWDGYYLDTWSAAPPQLDYNTNLSYFQRGGGPFWDLGRRTEGELFKAAAEVRRPNAIRTSESVGETVIDKLDLYHYSPFDISTPLLLLQLPVWETVYHDRIMTSDLGIGVTNACTPTLNFLRTQVHYDYHLGKVLGLSNFFADQLSLVNPSWSCGADFQIPAFITFYTYLQKLVQSEECVRRYRVYGRRLRPQPDDPARQLEGLLAVQAASTSIWRAQNGDIGIIASNSDPVTPAVVTLDVDFAAYGLSGSYNVFRCVDAGPRALFFPGLSFSITLPDVIQPQQIVLYELVPSTP